MRKREELGKEGRNLERKRRREETEGEKEGGRREGEGRRKMER